MTKRLSPKFINSMIATGTALALLSAGISAAYKYKNQKISLAFAGLALGETACMGTWIYMKEKSQRT